MGGGVRRGRFESLPRWRTGTQEGNKRTSQGEPGISYYEKQKERNPRVSFTSQLSPASVRCPVGGEEKRASAYHQP